MKRVVGMFFVSAIGLVTLFSGAAAADPVPQPIYTIQCGSDTYTVRSATAAASGTEVGTTRVFVLSLGNIPEHMLVFCTATPVDGGEIIEGLFLITPAR